MASLRLAGLSLADGGRLRRGTGVVFLVAFGPERRTYALRYDAAAARLPNLPARRRARSPGNTPNRKALAGAGPAAGRRSARRNSWRRCPPTQFVDARPPGMLISKTWSTAVIDTDRSEVLYTGGGPLGLLGQRHRPLQHRREPLEARYPRRASRLSWKAPTPASSAGATA